MTNTATIAELAATFHNKVQLIRQKMDLRGIDMSNPPSVLASLEQNVNELRVLLTVMRAENNRRKTALQMMKVNIILKVQISLVFVKIDPLESSYSVIDDKLSSLIRSKSRCD
jgi:hypothetical protein